MGKLLVFIGMSEDEHVIYFSSEFSVQDTASGGFNVALPYTLNLEGFWKCGVLDFFIRPDNSDAQSSQFIYILSDFCKTSFIQQSQQLPILKKVGLRKSQHSYKFTRPLYVPLKQNSLTDFDLLFLDSFLTPIKLHRAHKIECTLHFVRYG